MDHPLKRTSTVEPAPMPVPDQASASPALAPRPARLRDRLPEPQPVSAARVFASLGFLVGAVGAMALLRRWRTTLRAEGATSSAGPLPDQLDVGAVSDDAASGAVRSTRLAWANEDGDGGNERR